jgi:bidirectional [NiFe] hydrogenase diaphorase subunit
MQVIIDDKQVAVKEGETVLQAARRVRIDIPSLCHHDSLEPRGACRMCMVEVSHPDWPGWKKLVASCVYPVKDKLVVRTNTEQIQSVRKTLVDLLLARCPENAEVQDLARKYGVEETRYVSKDPSRDCILCGMCVRVCEDVIGAFASGVHGRGSTKKVGPAYARMSDNCIGCGACAHVCPTRCIQVVDEGMTRRIARWKVELPLVACRVCGKPVTTAKHIEFVRNRVSVGPEVLETCPDCLRTVYGGKVAAEGHM